MRRARCWTALVAMIGAMTACAPGATDPGLPADTAGPLTRQQAELLIEEPLADLAATVSERADEYAEFSAADAAGTQEMDGQCLYVSTVYRSTRKVDSEGWGDLARAVEPQMEAWEMDTGALDDKHRSSGAGLRGQNPHNQAQLTVRTWNEHRVQEVDGPTFGLEMMVQVPLADSECAEG
ncbi:hypothetical protein H3H54_13415 [Brachybacterium sp. Z12]|uniref:hypothetical protein n=1 Tax=Brachybacterium sp. Z12 TaxID=2759167 RepID=UPI001861CE2E|nr:hypothetical protein [Brachybacterium sp. Z12]QNN82144.1 hypothetical protein H3H54_13415 [Brachybacterium sp. Z12]